MSRDTPFHVLLRVPLLLCVTIIWNTKCVSGLSDRCLEVVKLDVDDIEDHLSKLDLMDAPTVKMMAAGFKCPISALPFGALKSDWSRLLLLQEAQPNGSITKLKLARLMRILIIAYFQMEEHFDVINSDAPKPKQSPVRETTTTSVTDSTDRPQNPNSNNSWTTEASSNTYRQSHSSSMIPSSTIKREYPKTDATTKAETVTAKAASSFNATTVIRLDTSHGNVTSSISSTNFSATTTPYYPTVAFNVTASEGFSNCLKKLLFDDVLRKYSARTSDKVFERLKNKKYAIRHAIRQPNEINDRWRKRAISTISPSTNDPWRYVAFPTAAPLTISTIAQPYRTQGLNGFRTNPWKSRKRASLNADAYESFRRFYDADENKDGTKRYASK